jgi:asparagine synthase (glutamine-hydrolysing)
LGMEVRHPFLDRRLADFLLSVPPRELFELGSSKPLLREAMKGLLPEPIRRRQDKTKLGPFIDFALAGKERRQVESLTWNSLAVELGILDGKTFRAESMLYFDISKKDTRRSLWYAFTIEIWLRKHRQELDFSNWIS